MAAEQYYGHGVAGPLRGGAARQEESMTLNGQIQALDACLKQASDQIDELYGRLRPVIDMGAELSPAPKVKEANRPASEMVERLRSANASAESLLLKLRVLTDAVQI